MSRKLRKAEDTAFSTAINRLLLEMETYGPDSPEYQKFIAQLDRLMTLRKNDSSRRVSPDTLALVIGNLLGIVVIVAYEQKHVMVSKATSFILKAR
jgi:hypothetical protein